MSLDITFIAAPLVVRGNSVALRSWLWDWCNVNLAYGITGGLCVRIRQENKGFMVWVDYVNPKLEMETFLEFDCELEEFTKRLQATWMLLGGEY